MDNYQERRDISHPMYEYEGIRGRSRCIIYREGNTPDMKDYRQKFIMDDYQQRRVISHPLYEYEGRRSMCSHRVGNPPARTLNIKKIEADVEDYSHILMLDATIRVAREAFKNSERDPIEQVD